MLGPGLASTTCAAPRAVSVHMRPRDRSTSCTGPGHAASHDRPGSTTSPGCQARRSPEYRSTTSAPSRPMTSTPAGWLTARWLRNAGSKVAVREPRLATVRVSVSVRGENMTVRTLARAPLLAGEVGEAGRVADGELAVLGNPVVDLDALPRACAGDAVRGPAVTVGPARVPRQADGDAAADRAALVRLHLGVRGPQHVVRPAGPPLDDVCAVLQRVIAVVRREGVHAELRGAGRLIPRSASRWGAIVHSRGVALCHRGGCPLP